MMAMWRLALISVFACFATVGNAQEITVRSGAHDGFARLVMRIPDGRDWSLDTVEGGVRIELNGHRSGFDTSQVFTLIDRQYIDDVTSTATSLDIDFACDCIASTFVERGDFLVVDVSNRPESTPPVPATALPEVSWPTSDRRLAFSDVPTLDIKPEPEPVVPARPAPPRQIVVPDVIGSLTALPAPEGRPDTGSANQLAQAQQKLARRVAIAATRGILDPSQRQVDLPIGGTRPQINTEIFDSSVPDTETKVQSSQINSLNLRISSSSDVPAQVAASGLQTTSLGVRCLAPEKVSVELWGSDTAPAEQIAKYRASLFSEFDRLDEEVAVDLARLYLFYGFGAEARQVLSIAPSLAARHPELTEIADIMEYGHARDGNYLRHFADCENNAALWGILAQAELDPSQPINADAALRAATALPIHLRRFVAAKLSRRLLGYGDEARAETALRIVDRIPEAPTAQTNLARAELQMAMGETEIAQQTLSDVVSSNEQQSAEALIQFVDSHLEEDTLIDQSVATLVEAYAIEMRGDPLGVELKRTHVLALAKSGQFDEAFKALGRMRLRDNGETERALRVLLLGIVTRTAPDVVFLERAFEQSRRGQDRIDPAVGFAMAERSAALGFPQLAELLLTSAQDLPVSSRSKELRARIALDLGRPFEAEAQLFSVESETADRLRARAKTMAQNYAGAMSIFDRLGEEDKSVRAAWLAEDWSRLDDTEDTTFAPVANVIKTPMEASDDLDGMMGRMSDAVSESQQARAVIQSLLDGANPSQSSSDP
ncbi:hypothetical protein [uncultured Tateyamaria sp.]|uniref:hypothetical protein n=1 Tax=Tateyamaria sp. 1078 TaxID=3417464 RepID=UPI0026211D94|nr:hypothetical protein [uncultured Tateyamaria sp.]